MDRYSVRLATAAALAANTRTGNVLEANANGALTVDGQSASLGDRVLVKNESTASKNGIYVVTSAGGTGAKWKLVRVIDMNTSARVVGTTTYVQEGTANAESLWACTNTGAVTLNSTSLVFEKLVDTSGGAAGQAFPPSADLAMGTHKITGLGNPTPGSQDAATAAYVDGLAGAKPRLVLASSVDQSVPTATLTKVAFPTVVENVGTFVVTGDTDIAVPSAGNYKVYAEAKCSDGSGPVSTLQLYAGATPIGEDQKVPAVPATALGNITNLIGYWPMNETSGSTVYDQSSNAHNGTVENGSAAFALAPTYHYANSRNLDDDRRINFGNIGYNAVGFTIAAWCYLPSGGGGNAYFLGKSDGGTRWAVRFVSGARLDLYMSGWVPVSSPIPGTNNWFHFALTQDAVTGDRKCYVNGTEVHSGSGTFMPSGSNLYMGLDSTDGTISRIYYSDVAMFSRVITLPELDLVRGAADRSASGTSLVVAVPGAPITGQTFAANGYAHGLSAGDVITAKYWHEKGGNATLKGLGHTSRIVVEKL